MTRVTNRKWTRPDFRQIFRYLLLLAEEKHLEPSWEVDSAHTER